MKAVFVSYNQALTEAINSIFSRHHVTGFTKWENVQGRGTNGGEPHYGDHTWPAMNSATLAIMEEQYVQPLLDSLKKLDAKAEMQGLRAFVWNIENQM